MTNDDNEIYVEEFYTWGCPVFVLNSKNQTSLSGGTPKWSPKSRTGVYLGHSPVHTGNVALILNLLTGRVSPQYHIIFDDKFETVPYISSKKLPSIWEKLYRYQRELATEEDYHLANLWYEGEGNSSTEDEKIMEEHMKMRETEELGKLNAQQIDTLGLRRNPRINTQQKISLKEAELTTNNKMHQTYLTQIHNIPQKISSCFQSQKNQFREYLETNFDNTHNSIAIIGQAFTTGKVNN